jgi:hypothetical protein
VSEVKICAECGRHITPDDRYCPGCGVAFAGAPARIDRGPKLPGFAYHFKQGLGWGLGLAVAGVVVWTIALVLLALTIHSVRW